MNDAAGIAIITGLGAIAILLQEWLRRREQERHEVEIARLRVLLGEAQRALAEARDDARQAQYATVRTRRLQEQAAAQRDAIGRDMAELRDAYINLAAQHRQTVIFALAQGLKAVKLFNVN